MYFKSKKTLFSEKLENNSIYLLDVRDRAKTNIGLLPFRKVVEYKIEDK